MVTEGQNITAFVEILALISASLQLYMKNNINQELS